MQQKTKSKCQSGRQSDSPLGPLRKKQIHDKIHWRTEKIKGSHFRWLNTDYQA